MAKMVSAAALCILAILGWAFRWQAVEVHPTGDRPGVAYLVNRWTGEIRYIQGIEWIEVRELKR